MQSGPDPEVITGIIAAYAVVILIAMLVGLFVLALQIFCWWRIFTRTGSHGALSLLLLVPFGKLIVLLIAAFGELAGARRASGPPLSRFAGPAASGPDPPEGRLMPARIIVRAARQEVRAAGLLGLMPGRTAAYKGGWGPFCLLGARGECK